jgi:hypothetical protein
MKKSILLSALVLLFTIGINGQSISLDQEPEKTITKITDSIYSVEVKASNGNVIQSGEYLLVDNQLLNHGIWTLFAHNSADVLTKIKYDKGERIWLETKIDGKFKRLSNNEIIIKQLETKIASLEEKIDSID